MMPLHLHVCTLPADKRVYLGHLKVGEHVIMQVAFQIHPSHFSKWMKSNFANILQILQNDQIQWNVQLRHK